MSSPVFGIDLGTTCSAIGLVVDGVPRLFPVDGHVLLPSVVSYLDDGGVLVGAEARNRLALAPERTIRSAKRLMGTDHRWMIDGRAVSPQDVGAAVLRRLRDAAEAATGTRPERVVITVPAWFTQAQRAATLEAGKLAGLEVVRIINEPTAAALAHAHGQPQDRRALVYDLGGGTFDVSLVNQAGEVLEVLASRGDTHLGGDDLDEALLNLLLGRLGGEDPGFERAIQDAPGALARLRIAVEEARILLSETTHANVQVPFLIEVEGVPRHFSAPVDRDALEALLEPFIERTINNVDAVLQDAGVAAADVDELLLVGGASRTPMVWHRLKDRFGLEGSAAVPPDLAVALGAAVQGAIIEGREVTGILVDVAPYALSVGASTGPIPSMPTHAICRVITPRNAPLPSRHTERFATMGPRQHTIVIPVFQGSSKNPLKNAIVGEIRMDNLPPAPSGRVNRPIAVEFRHDLDGLVSIRVTDELSGRSAAGTVVTGSEEVAELRAHLQDWMQDLIPGDGFEEEEDEPGAALEGELVPAAGQNAEPGEMRETFSAVIAARGRIAREFPRTVDELVGLATRGMRSLDEGDEDDAREPFEVLSDRLFELGIYL